MLCWGFWWLAVPQQWVFNCFLQLLNPSLVVGQEGGGEMSPCCYVAQLWPSSTEGEHFCISIPNLASFTSVFFLMLYKFCIIILCAEAESLKPDLLCCRPQRHRGTRRWCGTASCLQNAQGGSQVEVGVP